LLLLFAPVLFAGDALSVGMRGGIPFGDAFQGDNRLNLKGKNRFLLGPTIELRLPAGLGVSFDVLYRRYLFEESSGGVTTSTGAAQWEFPLMVRYRFPGVVARPYVAGGPTFQTLTGVTKLRNTNGLALGAGIDIKVPFLHLTPELRYSRRFQDTSAGSPGRLLPANLNQVDFLVGFTF
jgi:hypothetical protein